MSYSFLIVFIDERGTSELYQYGKLILKYSALHNLIISRSLCYFRIFGPHHPKGTYKKDRYCLGKNTMKEGTKTPTHFRNGHKRTTKLAAIHFQHIFLQVIYLQQNVFDIKKNVCSKFQKLLIKFLSFSY